MRKELEQKLIERWPTWFDIRGDVHQSRMMDGFVHGDGWFEIIWRSFEDLEPLAAEVEKQTGWPFEVLQVKEKFGGLRVYANQTTDAIAAVIAQAQAESFRTCEICGQSGGLHSNSWIKAVCEQHASALDEEIR